MLSPPFWPLPGPSGLCHTPGDSPPNTTCSTWDLIPGPKTPNPHLRPGPTPPTAPLLLGVYSALHGIDTDPSHNSPQQPLLPQLTRAPEPRGTAHFHHHTPLGLRLPQMGCLPTPDTSHCAATGPLTHPRPPCSEQPRVRWACLCSSRLAQRLPGPLAFCPPRAPLAWPALLRASP